MKGDARERWREPYSLTVAHELRMGRLGREQLDEFPFR
jgi:hypothetical protein